MAALNQSTVTGGTVILTGKRNSDSPADLPRPSMYNVESALRHDKLPQVAEDGVFTQTNVDKATDVTMSEERVTAIKLRIENAMRFHRVFTIQGHFSTVRQALLRRGWVEKHEPPYFYRPPVLSVRTLSVRDLLDRLPPHDEGMSEYIYNETCERIITSKVLENYTVDLYWGHRRDSNTACKNMIRNRLPQAPFTAKDVLNRHLQKMHWFFQGGVASTQFPRGYNVIESEEFDAFVDDFRLTACVSLLKYMINSMDTRGLKDFQRVDGDVPLECVPFAIKRCQEYIDCRGHVDVDMLNTPIYNYEWNEFLRQQNTMIHMRGRIRMDARWSLEELYVEAKKLLQDMKKYWTHMDIDGMHNIWLVKPANKCRGRGIRLVNSIKEIMEIINKEHSDGPKTKYILQKYLERPLIIYQTKFDIRQWFLVASITPLIIWTYKDCYLRFSSQQYDLRNYHEAVHLTNNAVQKKYRNGKRAIDLPSENMWDSQTFKDYLLTIGEKSTWSRIIYPGLKQGIIGAMLATQDIIDNRANSFELFGADFMLGEDFTPWLIEINSSPDMCNSTSVTTRLCMQCLEDVIKVVVDRRNDTTADTGGFECVYVQKMPFVISRPNPVLEVNGTPFFKRTFHIPSVTKLPQAYANKFEGRFLNTSPCLKPGETERSVAVSELDKIITAAKEPLNPNRTEEKPGCSEYITKSDHFKTSKSSRKLSKLFRNFADSKKQKNKNTNETMSCIGTASVSQPPIEKSSSIRSMKSDKSKLSKTLIPTKSSKMSNSSRELKKHNRTKLYFKNTHCKPPKKHPPDIKKDEDVVKQLNQYGSIRLFRLSQPKTIPDNTRTNKKKKVKKRKTKKRKK